MQALMLLSDCTYTTFNVDSVLLRISAKGIEHSPTYLRPVTKQQAVLKLLIKAPTQEVIT